MTSVCKTVDFATDTMHGDKISRHYPKEIGTGGLRWAEGFSPLNDSSCNAPSSTSASDVPHFVGKSGALYAFEAIKKWLNIATKYGRKELAGAHVSKQLAYLGIEKEFEGGLSPRQLPYTFF